MGHRLWGVALAVVASAVAGGQISADPNGKGYKLTVGEWLQPGKSCSIDLDTLSIRPTTVYGVLASASFPLKGQGILKLVGERQSSFANKEWMLENLPQDWNAAVSFHLTMQITGEDGFWHEKELDSQIIVPADRVPKPQVATGQGFIALPGESLPAFRDEKGGPATDFVYRPLTLRKIEGETYSFTVDGTKRTLTLTTKGPLLSIEQLEPTVEDRDIVELRQRYGGRCWAFAGAVSAFGQSGLERPFDTAYKPLRIRALVRLWRTKNVMVSGVTSGIGGNSDAALWTGLHPILAVVEPTGGHVVGNAPMELSGNMTEKEAEGEFARRGNPKLYTTYSATALDTWHMRRLLSEASPEKDLKGASTAVRKGLYRGEMVRGMTYRQLAWVRGWPMLPGSPERIEAQRLKTWEYPSPVFTDTASFVDGRFVGYTVPELP